MVCVGSTGTRQEEACQRDEGYSAMVSHAESIHGSQNRFRRVGSVAQCALRTLASHSDRQTQAAEIDLAARHVFCRAIAHRISTECPGMEVQDRWYQEAFQIVREGLCLSQRWRSRTRGTLGERARDLFRFGIGILQGRMRRSMIWKCILRRLSHCGARSESSKWHACVRWDRWPSPNEWPPWLRWWPPNRAF